MTITATPATPATHSPLTATVAILLALALGGCGDKDSNPADPGAAGPSPSSPSAKPAIEYDTTWREVKPVIYTSVDLTIGKRGGRAATDAAVETLEFFGFNPDYVTTPLGPRLVPTLLAEGRKRMAASLYSAWETVVRSVAKGEKKNTANLSAMTFWGNFNTTRDGVTWAPPADGPAMFDPRIKSVTTSMDDGAVKVEIKAEATFRFAKDGKPRTQHATRHLSLWMVEEPSGWKVNRWHGAYDGGPIGRDKSA